VIGGKTSQKCRNHVFFGHVNVILLV
jgi:hypothetical protein